MWSDLKRHASVLHHLSVQARIRAQTRELGGGFAGGGGQSWVRGTGLGPERSARRGDACGVPQAQPLAPG